MKRKAQLTIFIILGIVLVLAVIILFFAAKSLRAPATEVGIDVDETLARTCLSRSTGEALTSLSDDGFITGGALSADGELGPTDIAAYPLNTPTKDHMYIRYAVDESGLFPHGQNSVRGLCATNGPNARNDAFNPKFGCTHGAYHLGFGSSVQEMLTEAITNRMRSCIPESPGTAEVVIQEDGFVVRWSQPDVQHTERIALQPLWRAIKHVVNEEVRRQDYNPELEPINCLGCEGVTLQRLEGKGAGQPYDRWHFTKGDFGVTIFFDDRPVVLEPTGHAGCAAGVICLPVGDTTVAAVSPDEDAIRISMTGSIGYTLAPDDDGDGLTTLTFRASSCGDSGTITLADEFELYRSNPIPVEVAC